jgi:hypothetical protein
MRGRRNEEEEMNRKGERWEEKERRKFKWKKMQNQVEARAKKSSRTKKKRKKCQRLSKRCKGEKSKKWLVQKHTEVWCTWYWACGTAVWLGMRRMRVMCIWVARLPPPSPHPTPPPALIRCLGPHILSSPPRTLTLHCKKSFLIFPSPAGMSLTKLSLCRNNLYMKS